MYTAKILTETEKGAENDYYNKRGTGEPVLRGEQCAFNYLAEQKESWCLIHRHLRREETTRHFRHKNKWL